MKFKLFDLVIYKPTNEICKIYAVNSIEKTYFIKKHKNLKADPLPEVKESEIELL